MIRFYTIKTIIIALPSNPLINTNQSCVVSKTCLVFFLIFSLIIQETQDKKLKQQLIKLPNPDDQEEHMQASQGRFGIPQVDKGRQLLVKFNCNTTTI